VTFNTPNRDITAYLDAGRYGIHLVGDVNGTNGIMPAIHQAAAVARTL